MSDIVEKTLASIPRFLSDGLLGTKNQQATKSSSTRAFQNFIRLVNGTKSKHEEEQIVRREISILKQKVSQPDITQGQMCDYLCRALYCEMIGYDVTFIYIHAVKFAQKGAALEKRIGYLACSLLLNENHELILLLVNTIQKDLKSSNLLDNCVALTAVCQLLNTEMIPMVLPLVEEKLKHPRELVRMKAVMCLHKFLLKAPGLMHNMEGKLHKCLCDKDPGVMSVSVHLYHHLIKQNPEQYEKIGDSLIHIYNQIINRRLPGTFEYHSIPLPWLQVELLKCLALLGSKSQRISELMIPLLKDILARTNIKDNIAFAIIYEAILTATLIQSNKEMLQEASKHVGRFLRASSRHLQYIGIKALKALVRCGSEYVLDYQMNVVDCLDCKDKATQRKTLELLSCMANTANVEVVCRKLLEHLDKSTDHYWKMDLINQVADLADRFSTSRREWYVDTMFNLLRKSNGCSSEAIVDKVISLIGSEHSEGNQRDDFYRYVAAQSLNLLQQPDLTSDLLYIIIWVLSEYTSFLPEQTSDKLLPPMLGYFLNTELQEETRVWILSAIRKLFCAGYLESDNLLSGLSTLEVDDQEIYTKHRLHELMNFVKSGLKLDGLTLHGDKGFQFDCTLSFLDDIVSEALEGGAEPYKSSHIRYSESVSVEKNQGKDAVSTLDMKTYSKASDQSTSSAHDSDGQRGSSGGSSFTPTSRGSGLDMTGIKRVWSKKGIVAEMGSPQKPSFPINRETKQADTEHRTETDLDDEEQTRKSNLASALFKGIADQQKYTSSSNVMDHHTNMSGSSGVVAVGASNSSPKARGDLFTSTLPKTDTGGWRQLHKETTNQNLSSPANQNIANFPSTNQCSGPLPEPTDVGQFSVGTDENSAENSMFFTVIRESLTSTEESNKFVEISSQLFNSGSPGDSSDGIPADGETLVSEPDGSSLYDEYQDIVPSTSESTSNLDFNKSPGDDTLYAEFYSNTENS